MGSEVGLGAAPGAVGGRSVLASAPTPGPVTNGKSGGSGGSCANSSATAGPRGVFSQAVTVTMLPEKTAPAYSSKTTLARASTPRNN